MPGAERAATRKAVVDLLFESRRERDPSRAKEQIGRCISLCASASEDGQEPAVSTLLAQALEELAYLDLDPVSRSTAWKKALAAAETATSPESADTVGSLSVDCFQDTLNAFTPGERQQILFNALVVLDATLKREPGQRWTGPLLARKASVLRQLTYFDPHPPSLARFQRLSEALRCAMRAWEDEPTAAGVLELGMTNWALSKYATTDEQFVAHLNRASELLGDRILNNFEPAEYAQARFYRFIYEPLKACTTFPRLTDRTNDRRLFRESYIYAEAATQLWYGGYPEDEVQRHLRAALGLLETALSCGYRNARIVCNLVFVRTILHGCSDAKTELTQLCNKEGLDWSRVLKMITNADHLDLVAQGFALGIHQSSVITRLGTFSNSFLDEPTLAEGLFRTAYRLNTHDPIAITNLARFLVRQNPKNNFVEARALLEKARQFSDRRFLWWREVQTELESAISASKPKPPTRSARNLRLQCDDLRQVRKFFKDIELLESPVERGYALQVLIFQAARLTFSMAAPAYTFKRLGGDVSQVDAYFEFDANKYRVECKWQTAPASRDDILAFAYRLDVVGVSGLFISMSGFTESARAAARELAHEKALLLMDGSEARRVFEGRENFDVILSIKRLHFDQKSEPYHQVGPGIEVSS